MTATERLRRQVVLQGRWPNVQGVLDDLANPSFLAFGNVQNVLYASTMIQRGQRLED